MNDNSPLSNYLSRVKAIPYPLPRKRELELAESIGEGNGKAVMELAKQYLGLAAERAEEFHDKEAWRGITLMQAIESANVGLAFAARRYGQAENRAKPFGLFASGYIKLYLDRLKT